MAQPLLRQSKTHGTLNTPAKFMPLWKSDDEVAPSPKYTRAEAFCLRILAAQAKPTAWVICVPTGELMEHQPTSRQVVWFGICRPCTVSLALPNMLSMNFCNGKPRINAAPNSR